MLTSTRETLFKAHCPELAGVVSAASVLRSLTTPACESIDAPWRHCEYQKSLSRSEVLDSQVLVALWSSENRRRCPAQPTIRPTLLSPSSASGGFAAPHRPSTPLRGATVATRPASN